MVTVVVGCDSEEGLLICALLGQLLVDRWEAEERPYHPSPRRQVILPRRLPSVGDVVL